MTENTPTKKDIEKAADNFSSEDEQAYNPLKNKNLSATQAQAAEISKLFKKIDKEPQQEQVSVSKTKREEFDRKMEAKRRANLERTEKNRRKRQKRKKGKAEQSNVPYESDDKPEADKNIYGPAFPEESEEPEEAVLVVKVEPAVESPKVVKEESIPETVPKKAKKAAVRLIEHDD
ncbi:hypothetical protein MP638_000061 [Amoeboaphelidium occidentale]|nr:hypothetical protein MP638_000061 [Amoeboaphelidium occidentale]